MLMIGLRKEMKKVKKVWGNEIWIVNSDMYCGKVLNLKKGFSCSFHYHKLKDETFMVLEGRIIMRLHDDVFVMKPGDSCHVPPWTNHRFTGVKDSKIIEFSTRHFEDDSYRIEKSREVI